MKKVAGIVALCAALVLAPMAASAHAKRHHVKDAELIGVGAGVAAGAVVAGPVGAIVGGVVGWVVVRHHY